MLLVLSPALRRPVHEAVYDGVAFGKAVKKARSTGATDPAGDDGPQLRLVM